jgi:hypothetical protein
VFSAKPIWDPVALKDAVVEEGNDAVLACNARSAAGELPPNPPEWYKNGAPMASGYGKAKDKIIIDQLFCI